MARRTGVADDPLRQKWRVRLASLRARRADFLVVGLTALVTGASSGIGRAIAVQLAGRGYNLIVTARREELLEELAAELRAGRSTTVEVVPADLRDREQLASVIERAAAADLLVANAGFSTRGAFASLDPTLELGQIELNVCSTVALCRSAAAYMQQQGRGHILITSSAASFQPLPRLATYGASKAFLTSFALALNAELRPDGITVTCLAPGFTSEQVRADLPGPRLLWLSAEQVACAGLDGLFAGRRIVVPGTAWRVIATVAPRLPAALTARAARYVGGRMSDR